MGLVGRAMRCSPQEELNRDGPGEEIDGEVCSWGKNRGGGIRARRKTSGVVRWFGDLGMAMEGGLGCLL